MTTLVLAAAEEEGFQGPSARDFELPPIVAGITKPMVLLVLAAAIAFAFYWFAFRRAQVVPSRLQFAGESVYGFVRNNIGRDLIGSKDFLPYVPFLVALFTFILVNNVFGITPLLQFPTMSRVSFPYVLAAIVWLTYNYVGIRRHGLGGYFRLQTMPPGVPAWIYPILIPLEFLSNIIIRPITLSLRLFANMFAGHLLLLVFVLGGEYMLVEGGLAVKLLSPFAFGMGVVMSFFELLVQVLQAYIFTLLTALFIGSALADEH